MAKCCCVAAGQSPWVQPELRLRLKLVNDGPVCDAQYHWSVTLLGALYKWTLSFTFLFNSWLPFLCWRSVHSSILATRSKPDEFSSSYVSTCRVRPNIALKFQAIAEQSEKILKGLFLPPLVFSRCFIFISDAIMLHYFLKPSALCGNKV